MYVHTYVDTSYVCRHSVALLHVYICSYVLYTHVRYVHKYVCTYLLNSHSNSEPLPLEVEMRKVKPSLTSPQHQKSIPPLASFNSRSRTHPFRLLPLSPDATSSIFHEVDAATWYKVSTRDFGKLGAGLGESAVSWQFGRHLLDKYPVSCRVSVGTLLRTYVHGGVECSP